MTKKYQYTPTFIKSLNPGEIFVFGSNLQGQHGGDAAWIAHANFGAIWGQGVGLQGSSYAIPTMQGGVDTIKPYVDEFIEFAKQHPELTFLVTPIGCGIAGFSPEEIAPLFSEALKETNIVLPESFVNILGSIKIPEAIIDMLYGQTRTLVDILVSMDKQEPVKSADDACSRLEKFVSNNLRGGDEIAFMSIRTIWCLLNRHEGEKGKVNIKELEKEMYDFHKNQFVNDASVVPIYYRYCVSKLIRYISFLNSFRRYTSYDQICDDINRTVHVRDCSENERDYFFSFAWRMLLCFQYVLHNKKEKLFPDGHLDADAFEKVIFKEHEELLKTLGIKRLIREAYKTVGCHDELKGPSRIIGPFYRIERGGHIERLCNGEDRIQGNSTDFELRNAISLLEKDNHYTFKGEKGFRIFYPVDDLTLPLFREREGMLRFNSQDEKLAYIEQIKQNVHRF